MPDIGEIEDICKYVVAYTGKRNHTSQKETTAIQDLITRQVFQKYLQTIKICFSFYLLSSFSTHEGNMGGTRYITQKALHGMSAQRTVTIQEAVHMVDNQDLVICSETFTYLSLCHGAILTSEKDG